MNKKDDLNQKILRWLDEQGYPLEMRVASNLQRMGFRVVQSEYYVDPESGDSRELDVVAYKQERCSDVTLRVSLLIECKRSTDKPWLLFTSDKVRLGSPARIAQRAANALGRQFLTQICQHDDVQELSIFDLPPRPAYGITQALTNGKDVCYSAVTSVSKAALATVEMIDKQKEESKRRFVLRQSNICQIVLPVIVVEGRLFEVFLQEEQQVSVNEIAAGTLLWRNPMVGMPHTIINVISADAFEQFANETSASIQSLLDLSSGKLSQSLKTALERENRAPVRLL